MSEEKGKGGAAAAAAPAKEGEKAADDKPAKKGLNKKVIVIAGILVADIAIMAGLGMFIVSKLKGAPDPAAEMQKEQEEADKKKKEMVTKIGKVLPKPLPFTVNIAGAAPGETHYLKCALQLEWDGEEEKGGGEGKEGGATLDATGKEIEKRMAKITDIIINILSSQSYSEMLKPAGKQKIKESIVTEINAILPDPEPDKKKHDAEHPAPTGKLRGAFFTEFLVQ
jgi:flagellar basal body-associated protein FliL